jgi:hypothetical protein
MLQSLLTQGPTKMLKPEGATFTRIGSMKKYPTFVSSLALDDLWQVLVAGVASCTVIRISLQSADAT